MALLVNRDASAPGLASVEKGVLSVTLKALVTLLPDGAQRRCYLINIK